MLFTKRLETVSSSLEYGRCGLIVIRKLKKGPDLEKYLEGRKRTFVSYAQGARMYSMSYYTFIKFAKEAGANIHIKKNVVVDVGAIEAYIQKNREGGPNSNEKKKSD